jgi:hypothetical protein
VEGFNLRHFGHGIQLKKNYGTRVEDYLGKITLKKKRPILPIFLGQMLKLAFFFGKSEFT